jgi:hypothetical protein
MKKNFFLLSICILVFNFSFSANLRIRLNNTTGDYTYLGGDQPNTPQYHHKDFAGCAWTNQGIPFYARSFIKFDLSQLPAGATISSVHLSLFGNTQPINPNHSQLSGSNNCFLRRVTQSWSSATATFNTMPTHTTINQVALAPSNSPLQDYLNIDVTNLFNDIITSGQNNGILIMLNTEQYYRSLNFASGANTDTTKQPLLEIIYNVPQACTPFLFNYLNGFDDATITSANPTTNYVSSSDFVAFVDDNKGTPVIGRSLFYFDYTLIPQNSTIVSANLDLYSNPNPTFQPTTLNGDNDCILVKVKQSWSPSTVNFTNQPMVDTSYSVLIPPPSTNNQNYIGIDITSIVSNIVSNPLSGFGLMLKLVKETGIKSLNFCSSDYPLTSLRPLINICYLTSTGQQETINIPVSVKIYPNPAANEITIDEFTNVKSYTVTNSIGVLVVINKKFSSSNYAKFDISNLSSGMYILTMETEQGTRSYKFVKN